MKELGTSGQISEPMRSADADMEDIQEQEVSSSDSVREDSDLAQLRSLNDGECSADWYNFQESLAQLQVLEEEVVDNHKKLLGNLENWVQQDYTLLTMTNEVDYDQDGELRFPFHGHMSEINLFQLIRNCWRRLSSKRKWSSTIYFRKLEPSGMP